ALALVVVAHFSWPLALLLAVAVLWHLRRIQAVHRALVAVRFVRTEPMRRADDLAEALTSAGRAKEVRIFGLGAWFADRFEETWQGAMTELWRQRGNVAPRIMQAVLPVLAVETLGFWLVGSAAVAGEIGLGALVVYVTAIIRSYALGDVTDTELMLLYGTAGLKPLVALETLVQTDPRLALPGTRPAAGLPRSSIRFEGVAFRYPGRDADVFSDLTLEIPAGRSLAIVGANGAGKTTLSKLLARLYDPTAGRITVDGIDLRELDPRAWQRRVAAIFQDFQKYELSAYDNVAFGAVERQHERERVVDAARRAGALGLIEAFPKGWDTVLSRQYTGGIDVSGGQWQRIALARALFAAAGSPRPGRASDPGWGAAAQRAAGEEVHVGAPVLILDEPTAHLDVRAEAAFYDAFLDLTRGLTTIIISHRFSTVRRADHIAVLDAGGVLEQGSHAELMRHGGRYAELFTLQAQRFVDQETADRRDGQEAQRGQVTA
ncbi:MAG TPA: ABC transporter ATP-binding protein, partial [Chloroflexota bacterium]|nr:ABC transporter ATP-binding protein [Chloroflexota bacterium]